jgi:ABC-type transport system substrate-binding protein
MRKSILFVCSLFIVMGMLLSACALLPPSLLPKKPLKLPPPPLPNRLLKKPPLPQKPKWCTNAMKPSTPVAPNGSSLKLESWNGGGYAMGTIGLVYETLYIYDPLADKFTPWLAAEDMNWVDDTTLEIKLREGLTWQDGSALTADDVVFTYNLADPNGEYKAGLNFAGLWNFLDKIEKVDDVTVQFIFKENPAYQEVGFYLWQTPIVPPPSGPRWKWWTLPAAPMKIPSVPAPTNMNRTTRTARFGFAMTIGGV